MTEYFYLPPDLEVQGRSGPRLNVVMLPSLSSAGFSLFATLSKKYTSPPYGFHPIRVTMPAAFRIKLISENSERRKNRSLETGLMPRVNGWVPFPAGFRGDLGPRHMKYPNKRSIEQP